MKISNIDFQNSMINGMNGFLLACKYNSNLHIIKYIINDLHFNINSIDLFGRNGLTYAFEV